MASIDYGTGSNTATGDTVRQAVGKLEERLTSLLASRDTLISQLNATIAARDSSLAEKISVIVDRDNTIAVLQAEIEDLEQQIADLQAGGGGTGTPPAPVLNTLTIADTAWQLGTAESGSIGGATSGTTLSISGAPTGFTINSAARTYSYNGTGSAGSGQFTITETPSSGTPKVTTFSWAIVPEPAPQTFTLNDTIPNPEASFAGLDGSGKTQISYNRPAFLKADSWAIDLRRASVPSGLSAATPERQTITNATANTLTNFALLNTTGQSFVYQMRWVDLVNFKFSPWSDLISNDVSLPVIAEGGTQASPAVSNATEGASFGPIITANKPLLWTIGGPQGALFTMPSDYTSSLDLVDIVTDYETLTRIEFSLSGVDILGNVADTKWFRHDVTNNPSDDPVLIGWVAGTGTSAGTNVIAVDEGDKRAIIAERASPKTIHGELKSTGKRWIGFQSYWEAGEAAGFLISGNGVRLNWGSNSAAGSGFPSWSATWAKNEWIYFLVDFDAQTITGYKGTSAITPVRTFAELGMSGGIRPGADLYYDNSYTRINVGQTAPPISFGAGVLPWGAA